MAAGDHADIRTCNSLYLHTQFLEPISSKITKKIKSEDDTLRTARRIEFRLQNNRIVVAPERRVKLNAKIF